MLFCKPKRHFANYVKLCRFLCYPPVDPVFTGDFPVYPVEKSVDNVENSLFCKPKKILFFANYVNKFSVSLFSLKKAKNLMDITHPLC